MQKERSWSQRIAIEGTQTSKDTNLTTPNSAQRSYLVSSPETHTGLHACQSLRLDLTGNKCCLPGQEQNSTHSSKIAFL